MAKKPIHPGEGFCQPSHPWTVRPSGPPVISGNVDSFNGVVFTPANPCGATIDERHTTETPLRVLARWGGCVGGRMVPVLDPCGDPIPLLDDEGEPLVDELGGAVFRMRELIEPGDLVLVRGTVVALTSEHNPAEVPALNSCNEDTASAVPELKLAIRACGQPEPTIIDADSELVVPAGPITIELLGPDNWIVGRPPEGSVETPWTDAMVRVTACPCTCAYHPDGVLSEWLDLDASDPVPPAGFMLVRPRRARGLSGSSVITATGATQNTSIRWSSDAGGGEWVGFQLLQAGFPFQIESVGSFPFLAVFPPAGIVRTSLRWAVR